jgi:hypothetical protein
MYNKNKNSITLELGDLTEKFELAAKMVSRSGLTIAIDKVMEVMILSELSRLDPQEIAKRFKRALIKSLSKISDEIEGDDDDLDFSNNGSFEKEELLAVK